MLANNFNVFKTSNDVVLPEVLSVPTTGTKKTVCAICGGISICRHFGAVCCNSCAAFFRRTISGKKNYSCALINNCVIDFRFVRRICPACRLRKCIAAGMQHDQVFSVGLSSPESIVQNGQHIPQSCSSLLPTTSHNSLLLPRLQKFDHSAQFSSYGNNNWLRHLLISTKAIEHQRVTHLPPSPYSFRRISFLPNISQQVVNERRFCQMYLKDTGIFDLAREVVCEELAAVENYWNYIVVVLNTLKYDSIQDRKLTVIDHSMIEMSESSLKAWYSIVPQFQRQLELIVKTVLPIYYRVEELIKKIHTLGMTNEEQAFFLFLGMIEGITRLTSEPKITRLRFQPVLDTVFRSMHTYYQENFPSDCTATRMGNLIMAMPIMDEINSLFNEQRILVSLFFKDSEKPSIAKSINSKFES